MTVKYVVTFEFDEAPQLVHRGTASGSSVVTVVKRAMQAALLAHPQKSWSSLVVCLLERVTPEIAIPTASEPTVTEPEAESSGG